ncbi:MAG: HAD family phosphatase [Proteobacteria bacterium]|nr:HAD family phosphatase [Pseudomonadota bacterium]
MLFDLDGTLINTEVHSDQAISAIAARHGIAGYALPPNETHGRTWAHVAQMMRAQTGIQTDSAVLADEMLDHWKLLVREAAEIPGAARAIHAAVAAGLRVAIVSSSPRTVIHYFVERLGLGDCVDDRARIGADSVTRGKPDPEGYLLGARRLGADPATSLVFEDSRAGLLAARAAGMRAMFITCCATDVADNRLLATSAFRDYEALPESFWRSLAAGSVDLTQGVSA